MRKLISVLTVLVLFLSVSFPSFAVERTPVPYELITYDELPEVIEGQHHYLLLCTDVWKGNPDNLGNTDGIMLVTLDSRAHRIMLTSLIRDAIVKRPKEENPEEEGYGRVNYIAKNLGPEMLCEVLSRHFGIRIEKYILFDFTQIANIVDYLGGVDIDLKYYEINYLRRYAVPWKSVTSLDGHDLRASGNHPEGVYHFRGHSAVIYMRIRKAGGGGDFTRTQRARTVLSTLADKCRTMTWDDAQALVNNIMDNNTMTNMNLEEMLQAAQFAYDLRDCTIEELRLPVDGASTPINYANMAVQEIDWEMCRQALNDYLQNSFLVLDDEE